MKYDTRPITEQIKAEFENGMSDKPSPLFSGKYRADLVAALEEISAENIADYLIEFYAVLENMEDDVQDAEWDKDDLEMKADRLEDEIEELKRRLEKETEVRDEVQRFWLSQTYGDKPPKSIADYWNRREVHAS